MGNPNSKIENISKEIPDEGILPSVPIQTPKSKVIENDPRSPTANIVRTPIQVTSNCNTSGTPIVGVINISIYENQEISSVNIDPRSPTDEFTRTPINTNPQIKLRNKNLDNVKQQLIICSPLKNDTKEELKVTRGPKLLGVSPVIKRTEEQEKRKSYVGLLETNLDFVETDIDKATNASSEVISDNCVEDSPKDEEIIEPEPVQTEECIEKSETELTCDKASIISPIKETLEKISLIDKEIKEIITITHSPISNFDDQTNEFDKKITNLIYEDKDILNIISKPTKLKSDNRTPLSERNINHRNNKKSVSKLKVHDKPQRKSNSVSKIPVFKDKKEKSKFVVQCENTPPKPKISGEKRKSQWDADKTLII